MLSLIGYFPACIITHRYVARMILLLHVSSRAWRISVNGEKSAQIRDWQLNTELVSL